MRFIFANLLLLVPVGVAVAALLCAIALLRLVPEELAGYAWAAAAIAATFAAYFVPKWLHAIALAARRAR